MSDPVLLGRTVWPVAYLAQRHPPQWLHPNKRRIASLATPEGASHQGDVTVSRWRETGSPMQVWATDVTANPGFYSYPKPHATDETRHWHVNFADPSLFRFGRGPLFAQDELQIAEHPCLDSVAEAIESGDHSSPGLRRFTEEGGVATPVLVAGAPRRCAIDTRGIYGDAFRHAADATIVRQTRTLQPPPPSNILAIAALRSTRSGDYTAAEISRLLRIAYAGFRAAVLSSGPVTIHTGYWGCGAFGGNKGLVSALQLLAAGAAGVNRVQFWHGHGELGRIALDHAIAVAKRLSGSPTGVVIQTLESAGYGWGEGNENHVPYTPPKRCPLKNK